MESSELSVKGKSSLQGSKYTSWLDSMNSLQENDTKLTLEKRKSDSDPSVDRSDEYVNQISDTERKFDEKLCEDDFLEESDVESETFIEDNGDNLETCAGDMDTMLDDYDPIVPLPDEPIIPQEFTLAPGEGQVLVSIFKDENAEYLAFQTIFWDKKDQRIVNGTRKYITVTCKYEL